MQSLATDRRVRVREQGAALGEATRCFAVCYDGDASSLTALNAALDRMDCRTTVIAVAFIRVPRTQSLRQIPEASRSRANVYLAAAVANAAVRGVEINTEIIAGYDLDEALTGFANECRAERVFIGDKCKTVAKACPTISLWGFERKSISALS